MSEFSESAGSLGGVVTKGLWSGHRVQDKGGVFWPGAVSRAVHRCRMGGQSCRRLFCRRYNLNNLPQLKWGRTGHYCSKSFFRATQVGNDGFFFSVTGSFSLKFKL